MVSFTYVGQTENIADYKIIRIKNALTVTLQLVHIKSKDVVDFLNLKEPINKMHPVWFNHKVIIREFEATDYPIDKYKSIQKMHNEMYKPVNMIDFIIKHNEQFIDSYKNNLEYLTLVN